MAATNTAVSYTDGDQSAEDAAICKRIQHWQAAQGRSDRAVDAVTEADLQDSLQRFGLIGLTKWLKSVGITCIADLALLKPEELVARGVVQERADAIILHAECIGSGCVKHKYVEADASDSD
eukprot:TRINITY_DN38021_c0_g2_i1.p2 TRINITY_DN38021_c0_g2~~TRINITY_DN38021_c0_g2_i1.p2  ORF type:complete len:122 (+),score=26.82 TRINITY_DN38021_c0_g2_i1:228-593(+)